MVLEDPEKQARRVSINAVELHSLREHIHGRQSSVHEQDVAIVEADQTKLHRKLKGRHM